ncbi:hypothetical protein [Sulfuracidifex metallicus]|uniref:hypothetical protein n=1 Tax=Sulfuracidifex metallicus TaxID=47303 RepID=UPI000B2DA25B|nr:hypothetical protein [Sulfuracidifex metallicus]
MDKKSGNKEEKAKELIARLNRLSSWPLPTSFILIIGVGYFFTFYDISDIGFAMPAIDQQFHLGSSLSLFHCAFSRAHRICNRFLCSWYHI